MERSLTKRHDAIEYIMLMTSHFANKIKETDQHAAELTIEGAVRALITLGCSEEEIELASLTAMDVNNYVAKELRDRGEL